MVCFWYNFGVIIINRKVFTGGFTDDENVEKALEDFGFSGIRMI